MNKIKKEKLLEQKNVTEKKLSKKQFKNAFLFLRIYIINKFI